VIDKIDEGDNNAEVENAPVFDILVV